MKVDGNELHVGNVIEHKNRRWRVIKTEHVKPGKGGAYMQVELKDIQTGTKTNERFRASEAVERVHLEDKDFQFLYKDDSGYTFMDQETFDQIVIPLNMIDEVSSAFLEDSMVVKISMCDGDPLVIRLPEHAIVEVVEAEPVIKGQTATSSFKPAIVNNGLRIMVPQHITIGKRIVVNTSDCTYVERVKD